MKIRRFPAVFLCCIGCIWCFWYTVEEIGAAGNAAPFVWKQTQNLAGNLCLQKKSKKQKNTLKLWLRTELADGWQAAFWKWTARVYTQDISSTWESGDGTYLCTRCGRENTVHVFKSVSQLDVSLTDTAALWGLLALRWHGGRWNQEKWPAFLSC